jgi:predicted ATPase/DNA-binding winged helix-turn-helix (wHTH) protein
MMGNGAEASDALAFGPFTLIPHERLLKRGEALVELGARALDILIALMSRPNEPVSKRDLLASVWPDVIAEEGSLRFHMAGLRKALGDGQDGARYITTLAGRGYCFVAPIAFASRPPALAPVTSADFRQANLPNRLVRMVGRAQEVRAVSTLLLAKRFVTIVGAGGVGKTTVTVCAAHGLAEAFSSAVLFVDLGMLSDSSLVTTVIASMLNLSVHSADPTSTLVSYLRDKKILLILDTCEHVIEAVAAFVAKLFVAAPDVHVLATSREALQVEGEYVYLLNPLACPPDEPGVTAERAQGFPATQLFMERAAAGGAPLELGDDDAAIVGGICRKLDGVALAIELAARHVGVYGLHQTEALLDQSLARTWSGPRTAPPRQKTLRATLDWSYGLLSEPERIVLRRLAVFVGHFTLDAAMAVVACEKIDQALVFVAIDGLVAKSMLSTRPLGAMMRYRLLDTTRAYVREIEVDAAEAASLATRHAMFYCHWLEQQGAEWTALATGAERAPHFASINNVRAALEWCFGSIGDVRVGISLATAATPVFLTMSLLPECLKWSERAILALDDKAHGGQEEMRLQATLGISLLFTSGAREAARLTLLQSLAIAETRGDTLHQARQLASLAALHQRKGEFNIAMQYARRCSEFARAANDLGAITMAHAGLGLSLFSVGELSAARVEFEAAIAHKQGSRRASASYVGIDGRLLSSALLSRTLWQQGHPALAAAQARQAVEEALRGDHALSICAVLNVVISVFLLNGDLTGASQHIDMVISRAESYSFGPFLWVGRGFKGELAIRHGDAEHGVVILEDALRNLHQATYELFTTVLNIALIQGLACQGRSLEAEALADETIQQIDANGRHNSIPELLRVKGGLLLSMGRPRAEAEACFLRSLAMSRQQGARAWELRTALDLAALHARDDAPERARALVWPIFEQFSEGSDTADLKAAHHLLATLGQARAASSQERSHDFP